MTKRAPRQLSLAGQWQLRGKVGVGTVAYNLLTAADKRRLLREVGSQCQLTLSPRCSAIATCIDHDHDTGYVRGPVCNPCNQYMKRFDQWVSTYRNRKIPSACRLEMKRRGKHLCDKCRRRPTPAQEAAYHRRVSVQNRKKQRRRKSSRWPLNERQPRWSRTKMRAIGARKI